MNLSLDLKRQIGLMVQTLAKTPPISLVVPELSNRRQHSRARSYNLVKLIHSERIDRGAWTLYYPEQEILNITNISEGGLTFISFRKMPSDSIVTLVINMAEINRQITAEARVVWVHRKSRGSRLYLIGVSFLVLDENDRNLIRQLSRHR